MAIIGIQGGKGMNRLGPDPSTFDPYQSFQVAPTYGGTTNFTDGTPGVNSQEYTDESGNRYRYVNNGDGTGQWLLVTNSGTLINPLDSGAYQQRTGQPAISTPGGSAVITRPQTAPGAGGLDPQVAAALGQYGALAGDTSATDTYNGTVQGWQGVIGGAAAAAAAGRQQQITDQRGIDQDLINAANTHSASRQGVYDQFLNETNPLMTPVSGVDYTNYNSDPADIQRQLGSYNFLNGVGGGSLDYQAALSGLSQANYQTAALSQAALSQYASNPQDVQRQLNGLGQIEQDISTGANGQREALAGIMQDLQSGGDGQRAAIAKLEQELAHGGDYQLEALNKYRELSNPQVTAQERYLAEIARRSFESQDRSNREAQMQDLAMRGLRSGGAEIAGALASQERLGQDRTQAELGLQANAVGRSMEALQGFSGMANSLRAAQQQGLSLYTQAQNALRDAQQKGLALRADEENAIREAQQRGIAMYNQAAAQIRDMNDRVGLANTDWANQNSMFNAGQANQNAQFNANAYNTNSMFNAGQANQVGMFNAGQQNAASANNQSTRLSGGIAAGNMANSIRGQNDAIGMFNTEQSQITQRFNQQLKENENIRIGNLAGQRSDAGVSLSDSQYGDQGDIYNARTKTNAIVGNAPQDVFNNFLGAAGIFVPAAGTSASLTQQDQQRKLGSIALNAWAGMGGGLGKKMV